MAASPTERDVSVQELTFRDRHGVDVLTRCWRHPDPAGHVVIAHGASEHSGRYARFARAVVDAGYATYALDHRGHGQTADATGVGRLGPPDGTALIDDIDQVVDLALAEHDGKPVVLFGHSMGAMLSLAYATHHASRLAGLVLCGFAAPVDDLAGVQAMIQGAIDAGMQDEPIDPLAGLNEAFEPARTPFDWLSRDEAEVDAYIADPLCGDDHPLTYGFVTELLDVVAPALEPGALARISCPVLLITGDQDPAAGMGEHAGAVEAAMTEAGVSVDSRLYHGARHELLNETNRDEVTADVVAWLGSRIRR